jgi:aldose 1-epimerase
VSGTAFDFSETKGVLEQDFNNTYCLGRAQTGPMYHAARLEEEGIQMDLHTTQPGLHFYNGYKIRPTAIGHSGQKYAPNQGICLEAQAWPDSPNNAHFPSVRLAAGAHYEQITEYRFAPRVLAA